MGYDRFYVHYWTKHQNVVYKNNAKNEPVSLKIDAPSGFVSKLEKSDGSFSHHIFFVYCICYSLNRRAIFRPINRSPKHKHPSNLASSIDKVQNATTKETVADGSKALQTAIVRINCEFRPIEKYFDSFFFKQLTDCYVCMDVAHF